MDLGTVYLVSLSIITGVCAVYFCYKIFKDN